LHERPYILKDGKRQYYQLGHIKFKDVQDDMWIQIRSVGSFVLADENGAVSESSVTRFTNSVKEIPGLRVEQIRFGKDKTGKKT
jgi:hypothetical protein